MELGLPCMSACVRAFRRNREGLRAGLARLSELILFLLFVSTVIITSRVLSLADFSISGRTSGLGSLTKTAIPCGPAFLVCMKLIEVILMCTRAAFSMLGIV